MVKDQPLGLQWWWYVLLLVILGLGIYLLWANPAIPKAVWRVSSTVRSDRWSVLIGIYLVSVVATHFVIFYSMRCLHFLLRLQGPDTLHDLWSPTVVGVCESIMYPTALLMGQGDFIGLWLALKVAGQWVRWRGEPEKKTETLEERNEGRRRFNRFLVGSALSVILAGVTYGALRIWVLE